MTPTAKTREGLKLALAFLFSCGVFFLSLEIAARLLLGSDAVFNRIQGRDEATCRHIWVQNHRGGANVAEFYDAHHPMRGWTPVANLKDKPAFYNKVLSTNSRGLRGKREYAYEKPAGKVRILAVGDSFTFGEDVSDNEVYTHYLEHLIPNAEVINIGVHGYGHDQMLLYLKEEGIKYKPDILFLGFLFYDMERNLLDFRDFAKPRFRLSGGQLKLTNTPVPTPDQVLKQEFWRSKAADLWTIYYNHAAWENGANARKMKKLGTALIDEMLAVSKQMGAKMVIGYFPNETDFTNFMEMPTPREKFLFDYCGSRPELQCLSVRPIFLSQLKKGKNVGYYGHWDAKGHFLAAVAIRDFLEKQGLIPASPNRRTDTIKS
ncbi:MAG TPA: SGNH/GDSL hydrolase family protein [Verrucomicrobiae bacterium]|jgi:hypothetical protein|nr:SGNH/GDSL hydrolase family protein [Verrucomicrobiae bacterium]